MRHFSITFVSQNDQLHRLPPADFKNLNNLAWSEFCRHYTEKISPFTLTIFFIISCSEITARQTHTHAHLEIISIDYYAYGRLISILPVERTSIIVSRNLNETVISPVTSPRVLNQDVLSGVSHRGQSVVRETGNRQ